MSTKRRVSGDGDIEIGLKASVVKALPAGWKDDADAMSDEDVRNAIIGAESALRSVDAEIANNDRIQGAKGLLKDMMEPYRDAKKTQRAKIQYLLFLLDQRGRLE